MEIRCEVFFVRDNSFRSCEKERLIQDMKRALTRGVLFKIRSLIGRKPQWEKNAQQRTTGRVTVQF